MSEASFDRVISEHLALSERNKRLERWMPLDHYREGGSTAGVSPDTPPKDEATTEEEKWLDSDSSWDTTQERPLPEFDWGEE